MDWKRARMRWLCADLRTQVHDFWDRGLPGTAPTWGSVGAFYGLGVGYIQNDD